MYKDLEYYQSIEYRFAIIKNFWLRLGRGIEFRDVLEAIASGNLKDVIDNPSSNHSTQKALIVLISGYIYYVPFVEGEGYLFLKTVIPNSKLNKLYNHND